MGSTFVSGRLPGVFFSHTTSVPSEGGKFICRCHSIETGRLLFPPFNGVIFCKSYFLKVVFVSVLPKPVYCVIKIPLLLVQKLSATTNGPHNFYRNPFRDTFIKEKSN